MSTNYSVIFSHALSFVLVLGVALVTVWILYRIFRLVFVVLPSKIGDKTAAPGIIAAVLAILLTPAVYQYVMGVAGRLINLGPSVAGLDPVLDLESANAPPMRAARAIEDPIRELQITMGEFVRGLVEAFQIDQFPVADFLWFLLFFAVLYHAFTALRGMIVLPVGADAKTRTLTTPVLVNVSFLVIVAVALYLSLSALLAIPLMQNQALVQGYADDDLAVSITIGTEEEFLRRFPDIKIEFPDGVVGGQNSDIQDLSARTAAVANNLLVRWTETRALVFARIVDARTRGLEAYRRNVSRLGSRETIEHYGKIVDWFQEARRSKETLLSQCLQTSQAALRSARSFLDFLSIQAPAGSADPTAEPASVEELRERNRYDANNRFFNLQDQINEAADGCDTTLAGIEAPPARDDTSDRLGQVGSWTQWLLKTESMPLVIIVGLVGFSLLGAIMSRIVRRGARRGLSGLLVPELMKILAGGITAAMIVFLASYGGLAVIGETPTDPNPYVVFALCLVGATFSEKVWDWARVGILGRLIGEESATDEQKAAEELAKVEAAAAETESKAEAAEVAAEQAEALADEAADAVDAAEEAVAAQTATDDGAAPTDGDVAEEGTAIPDPQTETGGAAEGTTATDQPGGRRPSGGGGGPRRGKT